MVGSSLPCPQNSNLLPEDEMKHVMNWAADNKTTVSLVKTVELVFRRPPTSHDILPTKLPDIKRASLAKLIGVYIRQYVVSVSTLCLSLYPVINLLAELRKQVLGIITLDTVLSKIIVRLACLCRISH